MVESVLHKAKTITIVDLSNQKQTQIIQTLQQAQKKVVTMPPKSALLLTDVTDAEVTKEVVEAILIFAKNNTPYVKASVAVGAEKLKKVILTNISTNVGRSINSFGSRKEAMDWLASQP